MTMKCSEVFASMGMARLDSAAEKQVRAYAHDGETAKLVQLLGGAKQAAALTSGKMTEEKVSTLKDTTSDAWLLVQQVGGVQKAAAAIVAPEERKSSPKAAASSPMNPAP